MAASDRDRPADGVTPGRASDELAYIVRDGVAGLIAGAAGTAVLTAVLFIAGSRGVFAFDVFASLAEAILLDALLPAPLAGYGVFLLIGSAVWPLLFISLDPYLPGDSFPGRGIVFATVIWTGFVFGFAPPDLSAVELAAYGFFTYVGHAAYGFTLGNTLQYLLSDYHLDVAERRRTPVSAADGGSTTRDGGSGSTSTAARADTPAVADVTAGAAASSDAVDGEVPPEPTRDVDAPAAPPGQAGAALPPLLQFDQALERLAESADDPPALSKLRTEFERLRGADPARRGPIVSDMAAHLTTIRGQVPDDADAQRWVDSIENRIRQYRSTSEAASDSLHLVGARLLVDGTEKDVDDIRTEKARLRATVVNQGDDAGAVVQAEFRGPDDVLLRSDNLSMGVIESGGRKTLDTKVYVPSIATSFEARVVDPRDGQRFLDL